jgi:hypothetical protein
MCSASVARSPSLLPGCDGAAGRGRRRHTPAGQTVPSRQWVLAVPNQLRYFMHRGPALQSTALRLFVRAVEQCLRAHSAAAGPAARFRLVVFIHRFGSALVPHLHFHCVVLDGVVESAPAGDVVFSEAGGKIPF